MTDKPLKEIHWHGDSLDVIREFPRAVRVDIGSELYLLQLGEKTVHSKPFASVGRGVWAEDSQVGYRTWQVSISGIAA